jgi:hypothetical protein
VQRGGLVRVPELELERSRVAQRDRQDARIPEGLEQAERVVEEAAGFLEAAAFLLEHREVGEKIRPASRFAGPLEKGDRFPIQARCLDELALVMAQRAEVAYASTERDGVVGT